MDTRGDKNHGSFAKQQEHKHPRDLEADLNPNHMGGQNTGPDQTEREIAIATAYDIKDLNRQLAGDFTDDDLKQIPVLPTGTALEQGATYVDLAASPREAFKINAGRHAEDGHWYVPKNRTPYTIWNRLVGAEKPGQEQSGAADRGDEARVTKDESNQ
jgi:hypothetical protein